MSRDCSFPISVHKIGVFALSNAPDASLLSRGAGALSQAFGGVPVDMDSCICTSGPRRFAGTDDARAEGFNRLVSESFDGELLVAARGGYGVTRVLEKLDFEALHRSGKALCGYSDTSALLLAAWKAGCTRLIHGPMVCSSWGRDPSSAGFTEETREFYELVTQGRWSLECLGLKVLQTGVGQGPVIPTNLTLLTALLGTKFLPDLTGTILVLEDVNEPAHAVDRRLAQLRSAGILERLQGLVFGHFTDAEDAEELPEVFQDYAQFVHGPVVSEFPLGHNHPSRPLPLGAIATLKATI